MYSVYIEQLLHMLLYKDMELNSLRVKFVGKKASSYLSAQIFRLKTEKFVSFIPKLENTSVVLHIDNF